MSFWEWLVELVRRLRVARLRALNMEAASGAYSLAGFSSNLTYARHLTLQALRGIFQWAGFNVNLSRQKYTLGATRGLFSVTGSTAELTYTPANALGWADNIFPMSIARGSFFDLSAHITGNINEVSSITPNVALPSGVSITNTPSWRVVANTGATLGALSNVNLTINSTADASWNARISEAGVVWYHNFDSAAEVNQFRWTGNYNGGNDPLALGSGGNFITHVASGGADGGGFLRATYPAGSTAGRGNSIWWRPFNPFTAGTNGRGIVDPAASGSLTPLAFNASNGSSTLLSWGQQSNPGWYMHPTHQSSNPGKFQGHDYYLQIRTRRAQTPGAPPNTVDFSNITGKHVWQTTTNESFTSQELVTYGQSAGNGDQVGVQGKHRIYVGQNFNEIESQPNGTVTVNNNTVNWRWSGGWDTLLYHITPGTHGGTGSSRTRVEVWAQHDLTLFPAESGVYTKIWDVTYTQSFTTGTNSSGSPNLPGWNGLICGIYHNGSAFATSFNFDYDQIIFSKNTIAAPTS
jgi:hypothetical protein